MHLFLLQIHYCRFTWMVSHSNRKPTSGEKFSVLNFPLPCKQNLHQHGNLHCSTLLEALRNFLYYQKY